MDHPFKKRKRFFIFPLIALAFVLGAGLVVMLLWNAIIPGLFTSAGTLTYPHAIGLLLLCKILFGGFRGGGGYRGGGPPWKRRMEGMTPEEREKFRQEWRERCERR